MADTKKVYLPRMQTRPGFRHSYQGENVVVVEADGKGGIRETPAAKDGAKVITGPAK